MFFKKNKNKESDYVTISWHIDENWKPNIILVDNISKDDKIESLKYLLEDFITYSEMNDIIQRKNPCDAAFKLMRQYYINYVQHSSKNLLNATFENRILMMKILLIQNTNSSLTVLIRHSFMNIIYDIMMCISYNYKTGQVNNDSYKKFLFDLKNGTFLVDESIYTCILSAHKRMNLKLDELIEIGMTYIRMNSKERGTIFANFIQLIGIEHIEVILKKILENLYTSDDCFYEDSIIKKIKISNFYSNKSSIFKKEEDIFLNKEQYIRVKKYDNPYYYITSSVQPFYSGLIMQLNECIAQVTAQKKYENFNAFITPSDIVFTDKEDDISKCTHIIYTPYTKTGKKSKYPICCHFYIDDKVKSNDDFERNLFGKIYILQNNTIGKAKINIWRDYNLLTIDIKKDKNSLIISKIVQK